MALYIPAPQLLVIAPPLQKDPTLHDPHTDIEDAPTAVPYVPGKHGVHADRPETDQEPATHVTHAVAAFVPGGRYIPALQPVHVPTLLAPTAVLYLPSSHATGAESAADGQ